MAEHDSPDVDVDDGFFDDPGEAEAEAAFDAGATVWYKNPAVGDVFQRIGPLDPKSFGEFLSIMIADLECDFGLSVVPADVASKYEQAGLSPDELVALAMRAKRFRQ